MRRWFLTATTLAALAASVIAGARPADAGDLGGQDTSAGAQASGGVITMQAGAMTWTPPEGSKWAEAAHSDPPPGKLNPNQPYGCTYSAGGASATASIGVGGPQPGQWVFPMCAGPGAIDPMPPFWVTGAQPVVAAVQLSPVVVAEEAVKHLGLSSPVIRMAPPAGRPQLVGVATWLDVERAPHGRSGDDDGVGGADQGGVGHGRR
jgi:hypothetical protein